MQSVLAKHALIACAMLCINSEIGVCLEADSPFGHYRYEAGVGSSPPTLTSWDDNKITYKVVGNLSRDVYPLVDTFMETFSRRSNLKITKATDAKIYIIYEDTIIDQLMNDQSKLKAVGFPESLLMPLKAKFIDHPTLNCLAQANADRSGNINSAFVLSKSTSPNCIKPLLYMLFGLDVDNDNEGMTDACILYTARAQGLRTAEELAPKLSALKEACN